MPRSTPSRLLAGLALTLILAFSASPAEATNESPRPQQIKKKAEEAERRGAWLEACRYYDELVRKSKGGDASVREEHLKAYQRCLRRLHLFARTSDPSFRQTVARLKLREALTTYEQVVHALNGAYPDRARAEFAQLLQQGLNEVRTALDDPVFKQHYLSDVKPATLTTFKNRLETWPVRKFARAAEVREQVRLLIGQAGKDGLPVAGALGSALVMEFAAGACNALDEYSSFLTPTHFALTQSPSRNKQACAGLDVLEDGDFFKVRRVWRGGPAAKLLQENDRIFSIDGKSVEGLGIDDVEAKLRGDAGKTVEVEFERGNGGKQVAELTFRVVLLQAVEWDLLTSNGPSLGYLRINYFTEDTLREVKEALGALTGQSSIQGLILDLRGNPGGVFVSAVQVAELFLTGGVISVAQSNHPKLDRTFKVESPGPVRMPMVVLVDGDTASAAEVLAAALKESRSSAHTVLMGQTTFGKGSIQGLIELKKPLDKTAAIRLTVAKLFSPSNVPISGKGITPEKILTANDDARQVAKEYLEDYLEKLLKATEMLAMMEPNGEAAPQERAENPLQ